MMRERRVLVSITATDVHCSNMCLGIDISANPDGAKCLFFQKELEWDEKRKSNGYYRDQECKRKELPR